MFLNFMGVNNGEQDCKSAEISLSLADRNISLSTNRHMNQHMNIVSQNLMKNAVFLQKAP